MRRIYCRVALLLAAVLILTLAVPAMAADAAPKLKFETYTHGGKTEARVKGLETAPTANCQLVIPDTYTDVMGTKYPVTAIGPSAFYGYFRITSVKLPASIESIGSRAFMGCTKLTDIDIGNVKELGAYAFKNTGLKLLKLPQAITEIPDGLVSDCAALTKVEADAHITSVGAAAFDGCVNLTQIPDLSQLKETKDKDDEGKVIKAALGGAAFRNCKSLEDGAFRGIGTSSIETIPIDTFKYCTALTEITLPVTVQEVGESAFYGCENLKTVNWVGVDNPVGYTKKGEEYTADEHSEVEPSKTDLRTIGRQAFMGCAKMTHITIPTGTQTIGEDAFQNCRVLKYMRLPGTLTKLGTNIFKQAGVDPTVCKLGRIRYYDTRAKWTSIGGVNTKYDYFVITFNDVEIPPWNPFPGGSEERPAWITIDKFRPKSGDYVTITIGNAPKIDENGIGQVWVVEEQEDGTEEEVPKPATEANGEIVIQGDDTTAIQNGSISYRLKVMEKSTDAYFTFTKPSYLPASDTSYANSSGVVYGQQQQIPHTLTPEGKPQSSKPSGIQHKFKVEGEAGRWYQLRIEGTYHDGLRQTAFDVWVGEIRISGTPAAESPEQTEPSASNANSSEQPTDEESPGSASAPTNAGLNSTPNPSVGEDPEPAAGPVASPTPVPSAGQTSANTEQSGAPNVPSGGSEQPAASATVTPSPAASPTVGPLPTESASSGAGNGAQAEEPSETAPASSDVPASPDIPPVTSSPAASDDGFELTSASGVLAVSNSPASEEKHLTGMSIALAPTTGSLMDDLELPAGATAVLKDAAGNEITDGATKLATGQILSVLDSDGNEVLQTVVVVDGDVLGTGTMGISQLVKLAKGVKDASELTAAQFAAADRDGNGKLGITDLVIEARDLTQMRTDDAAV